MRPDPLVAGRKLASFRLDRKLALGGMAEIWSATEELPTGGTRKVALKVMLREHTAHPHFLDMFWDEVNIARRLKHQNIVRVFDGREEEGHLFQVLELIEGIDLRRILSALSRQGEWFPVPYAVMVARDMARALSYAHRKIGPTGQPMNIVHRDISPHNVMLTHEGIGKVLDFGIARASERLSKTRTGVIKGKVSYMAPEQALGTDVDARADIFATGVVLWEMLAMERLFHADSDTQTMRQLMAGVVPPVQAKNSQVPPDVAELVHEMLEMHRDQRPETMQRVENRLSRALAINWEADVVSTERLRAWVAPFIGERQAKARRKTAVLEPDVRETQPTQSSPAPESMVTDPSAPTDPDPEQAAVTQVDLRPPDVD